MLATGATAPRSTGTQFVGFPGDVLASQAQGGEIHVIGDKVSSRKTEPARLFLPKPTNVQIHPTPACASWVCHIENWFSRIQPGARFTTLRRSLAMAGSGLPFGAFTGQGRQTCLRTMRCPTTSWS